MRLYWVYIQTLRSDLVFHARMDAADSMAASNFRRKLRGDSGTSLFKTRSVLVTRTKPFFPPLGGTHRGDSKMKACVLVCGKVFDGISDV